MNKRIPKSTDQQNSEKTFDMLCDLVKLNPEIEGCIWMSAFFTCIVQTFVKSGFSYEDFCEDMKGSMEKYKSWFDEDKNEN